MRTYARLTEGQRNQLYAFEESRFRVAVLHRVTFG